MIEVRDALVEGRVWTDIDRAARERELGEHDRRREVTLVQSIRKECEGAGETSKEHLTARASKTNRPPGKVISGQSVFLRVVDEAAPCGTEVREPAVRPDPEVFPIILQDAADGIAREPIVSVIPGEGSGPRIELVHAVLRAKPDP